MTVTGNDEAFDSTDVILFVRDEEAFGSIDVLTLLFGRVGNDVFPSCARSGISVLVWVTRVTIGAGLSPGGLSMFVVAR